MAFKMKNPSVAKMVKMAGNNRTAMKMKAEDAAAMKMKKAAMKLKEEAAMKMKKEAAMKLKKESAMKAAKPDFPDIDGDGNTSESMKQAAADKKSATKMKKPMKMKKDDSSMKMKKGEAMKMKKPMKMKKAAMKLSEADKKKAMENAMPAAEVKGRFTRDKDLERQMGKLRTERTVIKRSRYATQETKQKDLRQVQKKIDALNKKGYFKAKARAGVK